MIFPLRALWFLGHATFRALGFTSRHAMAGDHRVHLYERRGEGKGPPALLVHGLGGNALGFLPIVRPLLKVARSVTLLELPGHGRAESTAEPAGVLECAGVLHEVLAQVGEPCVLIGSSLGGALVLLEAATSPQLCAGVVGLNPAGAPLAGAERLEVLNAFRGGSVQAALEMNKRLFARPPRAAWLVARGLAKHWSSPAVQKLREEMREDVAGLPPELLQQIRAPLLILWGEKDTLLPASFPIWYAKLLGEKAVERIPRTGHLPMQERGRVVGERLQRFYATL